MLFSCQPVLSSWAPASCSIIQFPPDIHYLVFVSDSTWLLQVSAFQDRSLYPVKNHKHWVSRSLHFCAIWTQLRSSHDSLVRFNDTLGQPRKALSLQLPVGHRGTIQRQPKGTDTQGKVEGEAWLLHDSPIVPSTKHSLRSVEQKVL